MGAGEPGEDAGSLVEATLQRHERDGRSIQCRDDVELVALRNTQGVDPQMDKVEALTGGFNGRGGERTPDGFDLGQAMRRGDAVGATGGNGRRRLIGTFEQQNIVQRRAARHRQTPRA
jgi:hypothetical protein